MELIATKAHGFGGRRIHVGQHYDAAPGYALALVGARVARYADDSKAPQPIQKKRAPKKKRETKRKYKTKEMVPSQE